MEISDFIVYETISILEAMLKIDNNGLGVVFVCDETDKLLAVVSDGDVRRYILKNGAANKNISAIANYNPHFLPMHGKKNVEETIKINHITALPILDGAQRIIEIWFANGMHIIKKEVLNIPLVIMAGGKGTRLYPYTQILPKPLIPIGKKTITEHILERFARYGCLDVKMIVNYKKEFIEAYFQDMSYQIDFIEEKEFLGTGGGLRLLLPYMKNTFFMTNCDILIEENYAMIYEEHKKQKNLITLVCAEKTVEIPYGTIEADESGKIVVLREKPSCTSLINTGLYVIEAEFLKEIPENRFIHITDIIQQCIRDGKRVGTYKICEKSWMDMGQIDELEKMRERLG